MPLLESTIPGLLAERARLQPDEVAYTFIDYDVDPAGFAESLTWSQVYQRAQVVAEELLRHGRKGDRAAILAPQGLEYIVAFYGAMTAGFIAVPLPVPALGQLDERVNGALRDCQPVAVLTTSAVVGDIMTYVGGFTGGATPTVVEVDALDFHSPRTAEMNIGDLPEMAYLQYTSGSTRAPAGVIMTHRNVIANVKQVFDDYMEHRDGIPPQDITMVSWLPFYHDMGLVLGVCAPILCGRRAQLMSPVAFLEKPSRWVRALAENPHAWSSAPNFAFDMAARKTADSDLAGLDLGGVVGIISGAERVEPATLHRFVDRFAHFDFCDHMMRPAYGLAEATVFVATGTWDESAPAAFFDAEALAQRQVRPCPAGQGTALVRYAVPQSPSVRIVDGDSGRECAADAVGEIWVHGDNVADGYWGRPPAEQVGFGATIVDPSPGTPAGLWLRTGDLGFVHAGELFIVGRIKDLLIIRGRNHYPEDIEATVQAITGGRVAAVSVPVRGTEELVTVVELKRPADLDSAALRRFDDVRSQVTAAISTAHGLSVGDLVLVAAGSIPTTRRMFWS
mgnify:CR=1 FL=1